MSLSNSEITMPVQPMNYGNGGYGGAFGNDGLFWIVILFLFAMMGGWNNGGGFGNGDVQRGFDQATLTSGITGINSSICNGFAQAEIADNARQVANLTQMFNNQMSINQGLDALQAQLANCCCENRAATADLKYTVATEACADRAAVSNALRDVLEAGNANTQRIIDKMCQQEIDTLKAQNAALQTQLHLANLAASQNAQTAAITADNHAQTMALEQYLNPVPIPAYMVQNPNCCTQTCGCGTV